LGDAAPTAGKTPSVLLQEEGFEIYRTFSARGNGTRNVIPMEATKRDLSGALGGLEARVPKVKKRERASKKEILKRCVGGRETVDDLPRRAKDT